MTPRSLNVLFVCERNSTRNIMAEALLNRFGEGRFRAFSADLEPSSAVHPMTLEVLHGVGMATSHLKPRLIEEFMAPDAAKMDFVICLGPKSMMSAVRDLPGKPMLAVWNISNPTTSQRDTGAQRIALRRAFRELENRIRLFALLRFDREEPRESTQQAQNA